MTIKQSIRKETLVLSSFWSIDDIINKSKIRHETPTVCQKHCHANFLFQSCTKLNSTMEHDGVPPLNSTWERTHTLHHWEYNIIAIATLCLQADHFSIHASLQSLINKHHSESAWHNLVWIQLKLPGREVTHIPIHTSARRVSHLESNVNNSYLDHALNAHAGYEIDNLRRDNLALTDKCHGCVGFCQFSQWSKYGQSTISIR